MNSTITAELIAGKLEAARAAELVKARRAARILAMERRYPVPASAVFGVRDLPYSQAKQWTAYAIECISDHGPALRQPESERHAWLCPGCSERIRRDLFTLAGCWDFLGELLQRGPGKPGERSGSNENAAAPLDLDVAELRRQIQVWCWSMLEHLIEDKPAATLPELTAPKMLAWLGRWHVPYIATHPADSFPAAVLAELADMVGKVRAMTFPDGVRRRPITSRCARLLIPADPDEAPARCGGRLSALIRDAADPRGSTVVCEADPGHVIPESEWLTLLKQKQRGRA